MTNPLRLGLMGGTFDPVHIGHLIIASHASEELRLDRVLFIPAQMPPHKQGAEISPAEDRVAMVRSAIEGDSRFEFSDLDLRSDAPSYTSDLVKLVRREHPGDELFFIAGADSLRDFPTWNRPEQILAHARLAVAARPGVEVIDAMLDAVPDLRDRAIFFNSPLVDISSSHLRERVRAGRSIRYLVPTPVETYIRQHNLYRR